MKLTNEEQKHLNYKPDIEYTPEEIIGGSFSTIQSDITQQYSELSDIYASSLYKSLFEQLQIISDLIAQFESILINVTSNTVTFADYKKALMDIESLDNSDIINEWEDYQGDVDGCLEGELYRDMIEVQEDLQNTISFMNHAVLAQIYTDGVVPDNIDYDALTKLEDNMYLGLLITAQEQAQLDKDVWDATVDAVASNNYTKQYTAIKKCEVINRKLRKQLRKLYSKCEIVHVTEDKLNDITVFLAVVKRALDNDITSDATEAVKTLTEQTKDSDETTISLLKKVKVLLKSSVDTAKETTKERRGNLRTLSSNKNKSNINQMVSNSVHFRNNIANDVTEYLKDADTSETVDIIANVLTDTVEQFEMNYKTQLLDLHKVNKLDIDLRHDNANVIFEKDKVRTLYKTVSAELNTELSNQ